MKLLTVLAIATFSVIPMLPAQLAIAQEVPAQSRPSATPDPRIRAALEALNLKYEVDERGNYKVGMRMENNRTQVAVIVSRTVRVGDYEVREVLSPAYFSENSFSAEVASKLLEHNAAVKLGGWQVLHTDEKYLALFGAKIDANSSNEALGAAISAVLYTADRMEAELTGEDRF